MKIRQVFDKIKNKNKKTVKTLWKEPILQAVAKNTKFL